MSDRTETGPRTGGGPTARKGPDGTSRRALAVRDVSVAVEPWSPYLQAEWEALARGHATHPFAHPGWTRAWCDTFRSGEMPPLLAARRRGMLAGALPVIVSRGVVRSGTHNETPVFEPVATDGEVVQAMAEAAVRLPRRQLDLSYLWSGSAFTRALERVAGERGHPVTRQVHGHSPHVDTTREWSEFERLLSPNRRKESRRRQRRLADRGNVTFEVTDGRDGNLADLLDEGFAVEASGWKSRTGTSVDARPGVRECFTRAATWASSAGMLRLVFLRLDGRPVAFSYMLRRGGVLYGIKIGFDPEYARFSPGWLLVMRVIEHACGDEGVHRLEMLGTSDPYKQSIADGARDRVRFVVFTNPRTAWVERRALRAGAALQEAVSTHLPRSVWAPLKDLRDRVHGLRT